MTTVSQGITEAHGMVKDTLPQLMTSGDVRMILIKVLDTGAWRSQFFDHDSADWGHEELDHFTEDANGLVLAHRFYTENGYCSAMLETYCLDTGVTEAWALVRDETTKDYIEINEASETWHGPLLSWLHDRVGEP